MATYSTGTGVDIQTADQETVWVRKIALGDRGAFEELFQSYKRRLMGYAYRMTGDASRAEELVSDILVEVWKNASRFQERSSVSTWIFGIAHHKVVDEIRRRAGQGEAVDVAEDLRDPAQSPESSVIEQDRNARLRGLMLRLTPEHREVLDLTIFQERSLEETAAIQDCPVNTVKTRMF